VVLLNYPHLSIHKYKQYYLYLCQCKTIFIGVFQNGYSSDSWVWWPHATLW